MILTRCKQHTCGKSKEGKTRSRRGANASARLRFVAKAIDMEQEAGLSFCESSLKDAAEELLEMVECSAGRAAVATEGLLAVVAQIALPEEQPSLGGGGAASNDLPRKKDDEWEWWKKNGFIRNQRNKGIKR